MRELVKLLVELERGSGLRERPGGELLLLHGSGRFQTTMLEDLFKKIAPKPNAPAKLPQSPQSQPKVRQIGDHGPRANQPSP